jgi:hypothetical protein
MPLLPAGTLLLYARGRDSKCAGRFFSSTPLRGAGGPVLVRPMPLWQIPFRMPRVYLDKTGQTVIAVGDRTRRLTIALTGISTMAIVKA